MRLKSSAPVHRRAGLFDELAHKPACERLDAVRDKHVTEIGGSGWAGPGGADAAVSVPAGVRKAMAE
ncbi:hypothetical protein [Streptomyces reniochalinae]|uniref:Uncharacterized protein n=1 Tax=Streptomyces reniochalinae TaxID=2250578 RepID=A0A367E8G2_9ACTN|nr:hypothetical protein [Streptomyces reniochalinae]RCG13530.1 hypothetical protein DQ392_32325 [Streptomyces reniochalinae]